MNIIDMKNNNNYELIKKAGESIKNGELVIFPTETVYGIGANGLDKSAVENIFIAKGRKTDNPLILHISNIDMVNDIAKDITHLENKLMEKFWPGPFTIVLNKKNVVPDIVTGNLNTVGVRMPSNNIARKLIEYSGVPIAAPSANISGKPSGTNIEDIIDELGNKVSYIIDGGDTKIGLESTVVRVIDNNIHILRPGYITIEDLSKYGNVIVDKYILNKVDDNVDILSPGMKYKHYAPNTKCILVYSNDNNKLISKIKELENQYTKCIVITNDKNIKLFKNSLSYGSTKEDISHSIFRLLREVDKLNVDVIIIEGVDQKDIGLAIMNRLLRACSYNYIEV
jgi:L-threonylcarbamoyladenylate synthase